MLFLSLEDTRPGGAKEAYEYTWRLFQHGELTKSQREAECGERQFRISDPRWASRFLLLKVRALAWRGMYGDALRLLAANPASNDPEDIIERSAIGGAVLVRQQQLGEADRRLAQADALCKNAEFAACGDFLKARGNLAVSQGRAMAAKRYYLDTIAFARARHDRWLEATASLNLGFGAIQIDQFDEAVDWSSIAYRMAEELGAEDIAELASGNLGWAYYELGDYERALEQFLRAESSAKQIGNNRDELRWIGTMGHVYRDTGDLALAAQYHRRALDLANQIESKEDIMLQLEDLSSDLVETGDLDEAGSCIDLLIPLARGSGDAGDIAQGWLLKGQLAAARGQDRQAEDLFLTVVRNRESLTFQRLGAGLDLATLYEREGRTRDAESMYKSALATFESARAQLKNESSRLPFVANAARIYDGYIHFLVEHGRGDEALAAADHSRARTLAQGLGVAEDSASSRSAAMNPRTIARKAGAMLLFYWLGEKQSYLWVVTPAKVALFPLPKQAEIASRVDRYRKALLAGQNPLESRNEDGQQLYSLLVAPAARLMAPNVPVMILADGALNQLNFETLLVPASNPGQVNGGDAAPELHYWIEDATVLSAPSLAMLAAAKPLRDKGGNLLLLGDPVSPSEDYPSLPFFRYEMTRIESHFAASNLAVFAGSQANPEAYLTSNPAGYAYIHFVSHALASRTDPLDSAIILSASKSGEDSFKLYAREIVERPIDARLVTISACYTSGARSYAGEGLVGLSWAFLRAGAHSVIGALWEVSDESTPRLMDTLYRGLQDGQAPGAALRRAKLALLHSEGSFRTPFYWAPFQLYTRQ